MHTQLKSLGMYCSCGITTGSVYCGCVGCAQRQEYAIIGDVVNMAARLMCKANGGIYVDEATTHYLLPLARDSLIKLEPIAVKGKAAPITIFSYQLYLDEGEDII